MAFKILLCDDRRKGVNPMENLSLSQFKDAAIVLLAVMAFIVLLGNVIKTIANWKKPHDDLQAYNYGDKG